MKIRENPKTIAVEDLFFTIAQFTRPRCVDECFVLVHAAPMTPALSVQTRSCIDDWNAIDMTCALGPPFKKPTAGHNGLANDKSRAPMSKALQT